MYSTPTDPSGDQYTSMFVFLAGFFVIGIPPVIEIDGIGLGIGYNRELNVPDDLNQLDTFVLVAESRDVPPPDLVIPQPPAGARTAKRACPPLVGIGGLRPPFVLVKNADAKRRLRAALRVPRARSQGEVQQRGGSALRAGAADR